MDPYWIEHYPTEILERIIIYTCASAHTNAGEPLKRIIRPDFNIEYDLTSGPLSADQHLFRRFSGNRRFPIEIGVTFQYSMRFLTSKKDGMSRVNARVTNLGIPGRWKAVFEKIWPCVLALDGGDRMRYHPLRDALYLDCGSMFVLWDFVDRLYDPCSTDSRNGLGQLIGFQHFTKLFLSIDWFNTIGMFDLKFNYSGLFAGINENFVALKTDFPGLAGAWNHELMISREIERFRVCVRLQLAKDRRNMRESTSVMRYRVERDLRIRIRRCLLKMDRESFDRGYAKPANPNTSTIPQSKRIEWIKGRNIQQDRLKEGELDDNRMEGPKWEDATSAQFDYVFENPKPPTEQSTETLESHLLIVDVDEDVVMGG